MAEEAGRSRSVAGVAFPSDVAAGLVLGRTIGAEAVKRGKTGGFDAKWTGSVPTAGSWTGTNPILPLAGTWKTWLIASGDALRPATAADPRLRAEDLGTCRAQGCATVACDDEPRLVLGMGCRRVARLVFLERANEPQGSGVRAFRQASGGSASVRPREYGGPRCCGGLLGREIHLLGDATVSGGPGAEAALCGSQSPELSGGPCLHLDCAGYTLAGLFPRDAEALRSLAKQAGDARMWAGIHFRSDVEAGRAIGDAVAALAIPLSLVVPVR